MKSAFNLQPKYLLYKRTSTANYEWQWQKWQGTNTFSTYVFIVKMFQAKI